MKNVFALTLLIALASSSWAQEKNFIDQPYIETFVKVDTSVVPDKIALSIKLDEADSKNKKSMEELESAFGDVLRKLKIDTKKDLSLEDAGSNFKNYFLKGQNVLKSKTYSLIVHDAATVGKVLIELENIGLSNVNIESTEFSKTEEVLKILKARAILKSKAEADNMLHPLSQKTGKLLYISDSNISPMMFQGSMPRFKTRASLMMDNSESEPLDTSFQKIKYEIQLLIRFAIQ